MGSLREFAISGDDTGSDSNDDQQTVMLPTSALMGQQLLPQRLHRSMAAVGVIGLAVLCVVAWVAYPHTNGDKLEQSQNTAFLQMEEMKSDDPDHPESLFQKLGGGYAESTVVDKFIETIMVDPKLNANPNVQAAHHALGENGKAGFKYLVWEIVNQATGGPVKYSGRSMKEAHWHLHITNKQWDAFAADFKDTLDHYKVPAELQGELFKIMGGVKPDIVNESPDHVPAPPAADADADPKSLYKRLGGIYAIAAVVNDFIDVIMVDPILNANPKVQEAHHTVAPAGFKNMVTQFVASAAGGPQIYTGKNMHDAHWKLDITYAEWNQFAKDFGEVLAKFKVPKKETDELFAAVGPLKTQVAHKDL